MFFICALISLSCLINVGSCRNCTKDDIKTHVLPCDPSTRSEKVISYIHGDCTLSDPTLIKPTYQTPCTCPPGQGLSGGQKVTCKPCQPGNYSSGGEHISDWGSWTHGGTKPPKKTGIVTFCDVNRKYVQHCKPWRASFFNESLESGDNSLSRCMRSTLILRKQFVGPDNYVKFTYRVEGRKCYRSYIDCDGLGFFVDNKQVMPYVGNQFMWRTVRFNITSGDHELKWTYNKQCFSFPIRGVIDKAFLQSITMVGTTEPHTTCMPCPPGSYSTSSEATECKRCNYFTYQSKPGQTSCIDCLPDQYSLPGSGHCFPMLKCEKSDLIMAPNPISTCSKEKNVFKRNLKPTYSTVNIDGKDHTLCKKPSSNAGDGRPLRVPCSCQPGQELSNTDATVKCRPCTKGAYSTDGLKCKKCPSGHVALMGKHFYTWSKGELPEGFTASCVGDCSNKNGWFPSGDHVRTNRVVGDVESYIQSGRYDVVLNMAHINFSCSILCNITRKSSSLMGVHLADIQYCNLVFEIWTNDSLAEQINCTNPKGKYVYRYENHRDGRLIAHSYRLKKRSYQFRWVFKQADDLRSISAAFEAKVFNISIVGVSGGSADRCTPCRTGYHSVLDNTDCGICPKGTSSPKGSDKCIPCKEGTFTADPGSPECLSCGANTKSLQTRDGCTSNDCRFSPQPKVEYDLSRLSRENGPMFVVVGGYGPYASRWPGLSGGSIGRTSPVMPPQQYWLNLCTVKHDNTSCLSRSSPMKSLPAMGCRGSVWSDRDTSIGRVIGFRPKEDIRNGLIVELLHGDDCIGGKKYHSTIDLICDVDAGVGNPGPMNEHTPFFKYPCGYQFAWRSMFACPKCRREDFEKVIHQCVNGKAKVTISRRVPCWGTVEGIRRGVYQVLNCSNSAKPSKSTSPTAGIPATTEATTTSDEISTRSHRVAASSGKINTCYTYKVLVGIVVFLIVALIIIASYLYYKYRSLKYVLYGTFAARNKPMSKLKEEEDIFGQAEGDEYSDTRTIIRT